MENNFVSIWIGHFSNSEELNTYVSEKYTEDGDLIKSEFMKDFKIDFIDHDFMEVQFDSNANSIFGLIEPMSYSESIIPHISKINGTGYNSIICIYNYKYNNQNDPLKNLLKFIGVFVYIK